jgi:hypothetical protein
VAGYPLHHLVVGREFGVLAWQTNAWAALVGKLDSLTSAPKYYASHPDEALRLPIWPAFDGIAISYRPPSDSNWKRACRVWHTQLSHLADSLQKPILQSHANLIGDDKVVQFKNRLRFWAPNVVLKGLVLNSIYSVSVFSDQRVDYFSFVQDEAMLETLRAYQAE